MLSLKLFLLILPLIIFPQVSSQPYNTLVAAIRKDAATSLYTITLNSHQHYVIDLTAPFSWLNCSLLPQVPPVVYDSPPCAEAQSYPSPPPCASHPTAFAPSPSPSPTSLLPCNCSVTPVNPVAKSCAAGSPLTYTNIHLRRTDGLNLKSRTTVSRCYLSCAPPKLFRSLPNHASGLASFSSSPLSFSSQFAKKFAICLPGFGAPGVAFFGDGPYYFLMHQFWYNVDVEPMLSYTPLLTKPNSPDFFIGVNSISVDGNPIPVTNISDTPTKLSTILSYTTLRTDVYKWLKRRYRNATGLAGVPLVNPVKPFSLCWDVGMIGEGRVGFQVADINLELGNGATWTIVGQNALKVIGNAACFAFLNGGEINGGSAIVIGSFQMEDHFLLFDMEKSRLGISPNLNRRLSSCGTFNFTTTI